MAGIEKIVSGGQTGADRAALDWAIEHDISHSGWCPRGRKAEDGPIDAKYQLQESPSSNYPQRTEWNVRDSDGKARLGAYRQTPEYQARQQAYQHTPEYRARQRARQSTAAKCAIMAHPQWWKMSFSLWPVACRGIPATGQAVATCSVAFPCLLGRKTGLFHSEETSGQPTDSAMEAFL
jgi:hypothetical protein